MHAAHILSHVNMWGREENNVEWIFSVLQIALQVVFFNTTGYTSTFTMQGTAYARYITAHQILSSLFHVW